MSSSSLSCERSRDLLVDLVCDELDSETAARVRSHATSCPTCGPELRKFSRVMAVSADLPDLEPSPLVEQRVLQAAREALAARADSAQARDSGAPSYKKWFARLGAWAMSPQVAMASVLVLVVGIGLVALPLRNASEPLALEAANDHPAPAASATATPPPAEPEPAPQQAAEWDDPSESSRAKRASSPEVSKEAGKLRPAKPAIRRSSSGAKGDSAFELADDSFAGEVSRKRSAEKASGPKAWPADEGLAPLARAPAAPRPSRDASGAGSALAPRTDSDSDKKKEEEFAPPPPAPAAQAAPVAGAPISRAESKPSAEPPGAWAEPALNRGVAAAQRGAYAEAISLLQPVADKAQGSQRSTARLWLARSYRGQGNCARALAYYEPLVQASSASTSVLEEAADCYERSGQTVLAGRLRQRAQPPAAERPAPPEAASEGRE